MRVFLIDFSNFLYKYKNTIKRTTSSNGVVTDISSLIGIQRTLKYARSFDEIVLVLDGFPDYFHKIYPPYKGNREKSEVENNTIKPAYVLAYAMGVAETYGINLKIAVSVGEEADQVISSIVHLTKSKTPPFCHTNGTDLDSDIFLKKYSRYFEVDGQLPSYPEDTEIVIGTTDGDMYQLMKFKGVFISNDVMGTSVRDTTPNSVNNLPAETIPAFKAFLGDTSDNLPPALTSNIDKPYLLRMLETDLSTEDSLTLFARDLRMGLKESSDASSLSRLLKWFDEESKAQFFANLEIARMRLYSIPVLLSLKDTELIDFVRSTYYNK